MTTPPHHLPLPPEPPVNYHDSDVQPAHMPNIGETIDDDYTLTNEPSLEQDMADLVFEYFDAGPSEQLEI